MQILSLAPSTLGNPPAFDMISATAAGGFDALGLRMMPPPRWFRADADDLIETQPADAIRRRLDDAGLSALALNAIYIAPETQRDHLEPLLDAAAVLGAHYYQVVILDPERTRALERFALATSLAAERGVRLAVEFKDDSMIETIGDADRFIAESDTFGRAGICLDVLHLSRSGGSPKDISTVNPAAIFYVELSDAPKSLPGGAADIRAESRKARLLPGEGELWIDDVLGSVPADTPIHLECPGAAQPNLSLAENAIRCGKAARRYLDGLR